MQKPRFTKTQIQEVVNKSQSIEEAIRYLGYSPRNTRQFKKYLSLYNIDISHFLGKGHSKGKSRVSKPKTPIEDYLSNQIVTESSTLKKRLLQEGYFNYKCYKCNNTTWFDRPIPLELHHKDCNHHNNNLENLVLLCPTCHKYEHDSIKICRTDTKSKTHRKKVKYENHCVDCRSLCSSRALRCKSCSALELMKNKSRRPSKEQLIQDFNELKSFVRVGKKYQVSDNAVRKWCRYYKILI